VSRAEAVSPRRERSLWAIASLVCSLALCPPLCVIGPLLGVVALIETARRPHRRGRPLAWTGIAVGLTVTAVWGGAAAWWNANVRRPMIAGPAPALTRGLAGDVAGFRAAFVDGTGSEAEARAFLDEVTRRWGLLLDVQQDPTRAEAIAFTDLDPDSQLIPYAFRFERALVGGDARFKLREPGRSGLVLRWSWIRLLDTERGDLAYPVAVPEGSGSTGADSSPPPTDDE
jgi:hypothetical protein